MEETKDTPKSNTNSAGGDTQPAENIPKEETSPLEEAKQVLDENKKFLEKIKEERIKMEKAAANMMIGGKSFANQPPKEETKEDKWRREAKIRYADTGMDPT